MQARSSGTSTWQIKLRDLSVLRRAAAGFVVGGREERRKLGLNFHRAVVVDFAEAAIDAAGAADRLPGRALPFSAPRL